MAAVAESAPTTRWRDEPRMAKTAIGSSSVYRPVTTGIPAIFAYPRATGMLTAARVTPASTSPATSDRRTGSNPPITGGARSRARRERIRESGTVTSACLPGGCALRNHLASSNLCSDVAGFFGVLLGLDYGVRPPIAGVTLPLSTVLSVLTLSVLIVLLPR